MLKMIATSGVLTALECTKFVFSRGSVPDPGALLLRGWVERGREGRGGKQIRGEKRGGGSASLLQIPGSAPDSCS